MAIQTDHALRGMEAVAGASRGPCRCPSATCRRARTSPGVRSGRRELPGVATELARKLSDAPHRRKLGLAAHRLAATRNWAIRGAYAGPAAFLRTSRCCSAPSRPVALRGWRGASCNTCGGRWRRSGSIWRRWRCGSIRRVLATAREEVAGARSSRPSPADARGHGDVPGDRGHPAAPGTGGVRAGHRQLHEVGRRPRRSPGAGARRRARGAARTSCPSRCSSRAHELATASTILDGVGRDARCPARCSAAAHGELEVMVGYSDSAKEVGMLAANLELYCAQRSMAAWAREHGTAAHDLPRPRRRVRPWRRAGEPGDRRGAAGVDGRPVQGHRARGGGVRAIRERRAGAAASGAADERRGPSERRDPPAPTTIPPTGSPQEIDEMSAASRERVRGAGARRRASSSSSGASRPIAQIGTLPIASRPVSRGLGAGAGARGPARDPVGVRLGSEPGEPDRLVRARRRTRSGRRPARRAAGGSARWRVRGRSSPRCSRTPSSRWRRPTSAIAEPYLARGDRPDLIATIREEMSNGRRRWS